MNVIGFSASGFYRNLASRAKRTIFGFVARNVQSGKRDFRYLRAVGDQSRHALRFFDRKLEASEGWSFRFDADAKTIFEKRIKKRSQK